MSLYRAEAGTGSGAYSRIDNRHFSVFTNVICSIAYEEESTSTGRVYNILIQFSLTEKAGKKPYRCY